MRRTQACGKLLATKRSSTRTPVGEQTNKFMTCLQALHEVGTSLLRPRQRHEAAQLRHVRCRCPLQVRHYIADFARGRQAPGSAPPRRLLDSWLLSSRLLTSRLQHHTKHAHAATTRSPCTSCMSCCVCQEAS